MRRDREESWAEGRDVRNATAVVVHSNAVNLPNPCKPDGLPQIMLEPSGTGIAYT